MHFLIFGTIWFWLVFVVSIILIIVFLEKATFDSHNDTGGGLAATVIMMCFVFLYYTLGSNQDINSILGYMRDNPWRVLGFVGAYFAIGVFWSIVKWFFYVKYRISLKKRDNDYKLREYDIPKASDNSNRIISWMSYWPLSALWTILDEPVKKMFKHIFSALEGLYDKISSKMFRDQFKA